MTTRTYHFKGFLPREFTLVDHGDSWTIIPVAPRRTWFGRVRSAFVQRDARTNTTTVYFQ